MKKGDGVNYENDSVPIYSNAIHTEQPRYFRLARREHLLATAKAALLWHEDEDIKLVLQRQDDSREVLLTFDPWGMETLERVAEIINNAAGLNGSGQSAAEEPNAAMDRRGGTVY